MKGRAYLPNNEVIHPITTGSQRNPIRPITQGPNFRNDNPSTWTPRISEMDDEKPNHDDRAPTSCLVRFPLISVLGHDYGDNNVAGRHTDRTDGEDGFAPDFVDVEHGGDSGEEHHNAHDASCEEGNCVAGEAERAEDCGRIVEDCVDAGPLLEEPEIQLAG